MNPANPFHTTALTSIRSAALKTSAKILPVEARTAQEIETAFATMIKEKAGAFIVAPDGLFFQHLSRVVELAAKHRLPSIAGRRAYVEVGGLMSYGPIGADSYRRVATYVDKIFKGAKPGDLPVEQPMKFELVINRKTAKALGLNIPQSLLISADKVIE